MKYLGIDYGTRRLGLAISDENGRMAFPHGTHTRGVNDHRGDIERLVSLIKVEGIGALVFGKPGGSTNSDATATAAATFAARLQQACSQEGLEVQLVFQDERYSTAEALKGLAQAGVTQRQAREADGSRSTDARAAAVFLQSYLDTRGTAEGNLDSII